MDNYTTTAAPIPRFIELSSSLTQRGKATTTPLAIDPAAIPSHKVVIVGDGAAGKTSLLLSFARASYQEAEYVPTVFDNYTAYVSVDGGKKGACELTLWDTAGQEDFDRLRPLSYNDADCVLLAFAVDDPRSLRNVMDKWAPEIAHFLPGVPTVLVGLKVDLRAAVSADDVAMISWDDGMEVCRRVGAVGCVECSAKEMFNVSEVFLTVLKAIEKSHGATHSKNSPLKRGMLAKVLGAFACIPRPFGRHPGLSQIVDP